MALKFVGHFVGDIHQPLHAGRAADERGGAIRGTFLGKPFDFHWMWDDGILHSIPADWHDVVAKLEADTSARPFAKYAATPPIDWANESVAITHDPRTQYVDKPFTLDENYALLELPVVFNRLTRAGIRLGVMLTSPWRPRLKRYSALRFFRCSPASDDHSRAISSQAGRSQALAVSARSAA
jgi:hypothetical protein